MKLADSDLWQLNFLSSANGESVFAFISWDSISQEEKVQKSKNIFAADKKIENKDTGVVRWSSWHSKCAKYTPVIQEAICIVKRILAVTYQFLTMTGFKLKTL